LNSADEQIRKEITERGAIPFARFVELALYCPLCGYYEKKRDTPGTSGDFYTSVSVGSLFGELLAFQFADWLKGFPIADCPSQIVEAGAHDGRLAKDILNWLRLRRPALFEKVDYWIIEPSAQRQEWQREALQDFVPRVKWFADFHSLTAPSRDTATNPQSEIGNRKAVCGVIFANELLDAMPVRRVGWDAKRRAWFEWGVTLDQNRFVWSHLPEVIHPSSFILHPSEELLDALPDGFTTEFSPLAANWWREAATVLHQGKLLTLDYGLNAEEFISPQRPNGTMRAYRRHRFVDDVLANPGEQDITAHVNFTMLKEVGERVGLQTEADCSQAEFLTRIIQQAWQAGGDFKSWTSEHTRQFQTLTHPEHLGRSFRVLVQSVRGG
jgi:SAM-dependent MidA family methyltransferase